jgi:RNA polymerase sigma-70 factor (ECF subfamily)
MSTPPNHDLELHQLVMKGDDVALGRLYDSYSEAVSVKLMSLYHKVAKTDTALIGEAIIGAFLGYSRNPSTFNPDKSSLLRFLEMAAERDLLNILEREKRYLHVEKPPENVELEENFWNSIIRENHGADSELIFRETMKLVEAELARYFPNPLDVRLARLVIAGERDTNVFCDVLEIQELDAREQQVQVKRHKDRIKKVLERNRVVDNLKELLK